MRLSHVDGQQQHIDNIYQVINDNPGITAEEISTYTGYDADIVREATDFLIESNDVVNEDGHFTAINQTDLTEDFLCPL